MSSEEQKKHPLEEYSENEQIPYLSILSAICYVDKEFSDCIDGFILVDVNKIKDITRKRYINRD